MYVVVADSYSQHIVWALTHFTRCSCRSHLELNPVMTGSGRHASQTIKPWGFVLPVSGEAVADESEGWSRDKQEAERRATASSSSNICDWLQLTSDQRDAAEHPATPQSGQYMLNTCLSSILSYFIEQLLILILINSFLFLLKEHNDCIKLKTWKMDFMDNWWEYQTKKKVLKTFLIQLELYALLFYSLVRKISLFALKCVIVKVLLTVSI